MWRLLHWWTGSATRVLVALVCALGALPPLALASEVRVLLRYDDYSSFQSDPRVIEFERALFEGVRVVGGHLIVGVIPFPGVRHPESAPEAGSLPLPLGPDKRELLKRFVDQGTVTPAVHGFSHGNNRRNPGASSEFAGLPEEQQALLLKLARRALLDEAGVDARVFVPPFNTYDEATLRALPAAGFEVLSAGRHGPTDAAAPIRYLPSTVHPRHLRRAVTTALAEEIEGGLIVATLHPYDFSDTGNPLPAFRTKGAQVSLQQWMADLRALAQTPGVRFVSVRELFDAREDLTADRMRSNERIRDGAVASLPRFLDVVGLRASDGIHYPAAVADRLWARQNAALLTVIVVTCLALWALWRTARRLLAATAMHRTRTARR